ncbi:hypothetical protein D3C80_2121790 [compost metagenome]
MDLTMVSSSKIKLANTEIMIRPAARTMLPLVFIPCQMAPLGLPPCAYFSRMPLTRNTS